MRPARAGDRYQSIEAGNAWALKVLFMTGYAAEAAVRCELQGTGTDMLTKPITLGNLTNKIQQMFFLDEADRGA